MPADIAAIANVADGMVSQGAGTDIVQPSLRGQELVVDAGSDNGLLDRLFPAVLEGEVAAESRRSFPIRLKATSATGPGVSIVALDVTIDGRQMGEVFDFIVSIARGP
jgi:hypothetical protein